MKSPTRRGLDLLLAKRPEWEVVKVEENSHWLRVDLSKRNAGFGEKWAIFRINGDVYRVDPADGAVADDPEFEVAR